MPPFEQLQRRIASEIAAERNADITRFLTEKRATNEAAAAKEARALEQMRATRIELGPWEEFHNANISDSSRDIERIRQQYISDAGEGMKRIDPERSIDLATDAALMPDRTLNLPPGYAAVYSTKDDTDKLAGGTGTDVFNYSVLDAWCWASGAGNGWFGSGAGSYQVWVEFGFWFLPTINKYYAVIPHNVFRGFYIVRSDDGFWTSKYARAVVDIWTNVYQYNWKGWSSTRVLDVGSDNINVNNRFDTDRHTYYSALLGAGDWAYIRNYVSLYVYARGGGSYAEANFAAGAANYLSCPHVHVY